MILRPSFINPDVVGDNLGLSALVRKKLIDLAYVASRQGTNVYPMVYVDAEEMPGAIRLVGTYTVRGGQLVVKLALWLNGKKTYEAEVTGTSGDALGIVEKLVAAVEEALGGAQEPG